MNLSGLLKSNQRNIIICLALGLMCIYGLTSLNNSYAEFKEEYHANRAKRQQLNQEINSLNKKCESLSQDLTTLKTLDAETAKLMGESFSKLSQVEQLIKSGGTDYKLAYLTFDDGPYARTYDFLKLLDQEHIQATFFTTSINGPYCHDNKNLPTAPIYKEYIKYGHTIGNHTYTHSIRWGLYHDANSFMDAVIKQETLIRDLTGITTNILRFPGGTGSAGRHFDSIKKALASRGYAWVDWTAIDGDGISLNSVDEALQNFTKSLDSPIEVVLMHDYNKITLDALPRMIQYARSKHYIFAPLFKDSIMLSH